jgi:hypothetical protein
VLLGMPRQLQLTELTVHLSQFQMRQHKCIVYRLCFVVCGDGPVIVLQPDILIGEIMEVWLVPGHQLHSLVVHRQGLLRLAQLIVHHPQTEIAVCQCRVACHGSFVQGLSFGGVVRLFLDSIEISFKQVGIGIVGMLLPQALNALLNDLRMVCSVCCVVDTGALQPQLPSRVPNQLCARAR